MSRVSRTGHSHNRASLLGKTFHRLTVVADAGADKHGKAVWDCMCSCGALLRSVASSCLTTGNTKSCGCLKRETKPTLTHGYTRRRVYRIWQAMLTRCENPRAPTYLNYGARGIRICARWHKFENFLADMGDCQPGQSIDRIDNNGNYEPTNCRWATRKEQASNTRTNRLITYGGRTQTLKQWADELGMDQASLRERLEKWSLDRALTTPKKEVSRCVA